MNNTNVKSNSSFRESETPLSGYDLPVNGLKDGYFYGLHVPALSCIVVSLVAALVVIIMSFRMQNVKTFFMWTKSERFVVYMAVCDAAFNVAHSLDHLHIMITKDHVHPKELCQIYGFILIEFISAQTLMVNLVAINVFMMMYRRVQMHFGTYDSKLLIYTFGIPLVIASVAAALDTLGPNGTACFFDGVKGAVAYIALATIPLISVLFLNTILYSLTWFKLRKETKRLQQILGKCTTSSRATHLAIRNMMLFVVAFFVQWWATVFYGIWQLFSPNVPFSVTLLAVTFTNLGGVLNGIVFVIIKRTSILRRRARHQNIKVDTTMKKASSVQMHQSYGISTIQNATQSH